MNNTSDHMIIVHTRAYLSKVALSNGVLFFIAWAVGWLDWERTPVQALGGSLAAVLALSASALLLWGHKVGVPRVVKVSRRLVRRVAFGFIAVIVVSAILLCL